MSAQTIFRVAHRKVPFSSIGNAMLRDKKLSIEARGCLAMILSYPPDWKFHGAWLCKEAGIGRDKARAIVRELIDQGYCQRIPTRTPNGQRIGPTEYAFTDMREGLKAKTVSQEPEKPSQEPEKPSLETDSQAPENQSLLLKKENYKKEGFAIEKDWKPVQPARFTISRVKPRDTEESVAAFTQRMIAEGKFKGKAKTLPPSRPI